MRDYILKKKSYKFCFLILLFSLVACSTVPITGRKQLLLYTDNELLGMSATHYDSFLSEHNLSRNRSDSRMVQRVGSRIQAAVEKFYANQGLSHELRGYDWEFNLVEDDTLNAWCMPGGRVVIYTGLLDITQDEGGLAAIMGHEIAHAIAKHGNERMSQMTLFELGGLLLAEVAKDESESWMLAYGIVGQMGALLPYSRLHESEADRLGLIFMAMAGYDPHDAIGVWERMSSISGDELNELLSTHPSDSRRLNDIKYYMGEALSFYEALE